MDTGLASSFSMAGLTDAASSTVLNLSCLGGLLTGLAGMNDEKAAGLEEAITGEAEPRLNNMEALALAMAGWNIGGEFGI